MKIYINKIDKTKQKHLQQLARICANSQNFVLLSMIFSVIFEQNICKKHEIPNRIFNCKPKPFGCKCFGERAAGGVNFKDFHIGKTQNFIGNLKFLIGKFKRKIW